MAMASVRLVWDKIATAPFPALALLYAALFGAYGTETPFFPAFLSSRGLDAFEIAALLSAGTVVRLCAGPLLGIAADRFGKRTVLALCAFASGTIILLYLAGRGFRPMLAVALLHSVSTAPLNPLADALALGCIARRGTFAYGWVRGIGSGTYVAATLVSGMLVARFGLGSIIVVAGGLLLAMPLALTRIPAMAVDRTVAVRGTILPLLLDPVFRRMLVIAALVIGSHAVVNTYGVIAWRAAGIGAITIGILWSEAVAAEILVFLVAGPILLRRLGSNACVAVAAIAGIVRWAVLAGSDDVAAIAAVQALNGFTFSLVHLVCMQIIARNVPERLEGTAQTLYGSLALGLASAILTLLAGTLWDAFGTAAYWAMAALCLAALPVAAMPLHRPEASVRMNDDEA